jgi:transcriptional regulator GlxA family with amidase domain
VNIAVLIYHEVLELELAGILTVFRTAARFTDLEVNAFTVSRTRASVLGASGLVMTPTYAFSAAPEPEVLFVPGGTGVDRLMRDKPTRDYLEMYGVNVRLLCSSTNGAFLLGEAGLLSGQVVTTFPSLLESIWKYDPAEVSEREVVVNESGRLFAGRSSGAAVLALHVVARGISEDVAGKTAAHLGIAWSK